MRLSTWVTLTGLLSVVSPHNWCEYRDTYYEEYSSSSHFSSLSPALKACETHARCAGVTQEPYNRDRFTLKIGPIRRQSPHGETSWGECEDKCWLANTRTNGRTGRLLKFYHPTTRDHCVRACQNTAGCTSVTMSPESDQVCYITSQKLVRNSDSYGWWGAHISCFTDPTPTPRSRCPEDYPHVYYLGKACCAHNTEKTHPSQEEFCDGGPIGFDSLCCRDNAYQRCADPPCSNYEEEEDSEDEEEENEEDDQKGCKDDLETCPLLSRQGQCSVPDILASCRLSCRQCVCGDTYRKCPAWAKLGMCSSPAMRDFMAQQCRMSCGKCSCRDYEVPCYRWAHAGHCTADPGHMLATCPASCNVCQCGDNAPDCLVRAGKGECFANANFMMTHCSRSCNQCGEACADNPPYTAQCAQWVGMGWCQDPAKQGFMMINCPKSCKFCEGGEEEDEEEEEKDESESDEDEVPWNSATYWMEKSKDEE